MEHMIAFALVGLIAVAVPGPDFAIVTRNAMVSRRLGVFTAGGIGAGLAVHAALATAGLSAILLTSATAFTIVKIIGALYLAVLGVQSLVSMVRSKRNASADAPTQDQVAKKGLGFAKPSTAWAAFRQGLLTNVLNPKAVFFFISLLPQFVPEGGSVTQWTAMFSLAQVVIAVAWFAMVSMLVAAVRSALARPRVARTIEGVTGTAFIGFAARLAFERR